MTQDEMIEMAKQTGWDAHHAQFDLRIAAFAKLVAQHEREACAKIVESHGPTLANGLMLAENIRARGQA
jgi:hypothetical protein